MDHVPSDPPLDIDFLSAFVAKSRWMLKRGNWKERLLFRLARAYLDTLTQKAVATAVGDKIKKWTDTVRKGR